MRVVSIKWSYKLFENNKETPSIPSFFHENKFVTDFKENQNIYACLFFLRIIGKYWTMLAKFFRNYQQNQTVYSGLRFTSNEILKYLRVMHLNQVFEY